MTGYEPGQLNDAVEALLPYDGPHSEAKITDASSAVSQLVRYMNNATQPGQARRTLPYAASIYRALGGIGGALYGLDQLVRQLSTAMAEHAENPSLYDDRRDRAGGRTAREVVIELGEVRQVLAAVADHLAVAREMSSHVGNE